MAWISACSALTAMSCAWTTEQAGSTEISHSARMVRPTQRSRTRPTASTPGVARRVASAFSVSAGSTLSISRRPTSRAACQPTARMAAVMSRPTTGSAQRQPIATPPAPASTASEVNPSVRACRPSATSAAEPIRRPVLIR